METSIDVQISYNESEIAKAISYFILQINEIKIYALIVYPLLFLFIVLSLIFKDYAILSIVFLFCGVMLYYIYYTRPIEGYKKFYNKRKGGIYKFYDDKVLAIGEEVQSTFVWGIFKKAYEIPSAFLLVDDNKFVYIFPKSCFANISEIERLRNLLSMRITNFKMCK